LVTINILNQHILTRALNTNTLIPIRNLNIMQIAIIRTNQINTIRAPQVRASNSNMVRFQITHIVEHEVEGRGINEDDVVDRDRGAGDKAEEARVLAG